MHRQQQDDHAERQTPPRQDASVVSAEAAQTPASILAARRLTAPLGNGRDGLASASADWSTRSL